MSLSVGQVLNNRYRIARLLGRGGFGAVYRAWDTVMEAPCAVKENLDTSPAAQKQFEREAKLLYRLRHPGLPRVFDHFTVTGPDGGTISAYLVMDYVEGEDLETMLERAGGPLPEAQVVSWIVQVCEALSYLHNQEPPVIHRDIKPANIRITPEGGAMLVDFGISKAHDPGSKTMTGARAATPGYSPPEQFGMGSTNARSDIYALGATTYHLLTGQAPPAAMDIVAGVASAPQPIQQINPAVSPAVSAAVEKAMQLNRAARTASAAEFKAGLAARTPGPTEILPAKASPETAPVWPTRGSEAKPSEFQVFPTHAMPQPERSQKSRQQAMLFGGLALGIALVAVLALLWKPLQLFYPGQPELTQEAGVSAPSTLAPTETRTPLPESSSTPAPRASPTLAVIIVTALPTDTSLPTTTETPSATQTVTATLPVGVGVPLPVPAAAISPDKAAQIIQLANRAPWGIYQPLISGANANRLKNTLMQVAWSPDGQFIAVANMTERDFILYDADTMDDVRLISTRVLAVAFSPDGKSLAAYSHLTGQVIIRQVSDGSIVDDTARTYGGVAPADFSNDFKYFAHVIGSRDSYLTILRMEDGELLKEVKAHNGTSIDVVRFSPDLQRLATGGADKKINLWSLPNVAWIGGLSGHTGGVTSLAFTADGAILASGSSDRTIRLWQIDNAHRLGTFEGHTGDVTSLAFSSDGQVLASGSNDKTVRLWRVSDGALLATLKGHEDMVSSLAFSPDGLYLASVSPDGTLRIWGVAPTVVAFANPLDQ